MSLGTLINVNAVSGSVVSEAICASLLSSASKISISVYAFFVLSAIVHSVGALVNVFTAAIIISESVSALKLAFIASWSVNTVFMFHLT